MKGNGRIIALIAVIAVVVVFVILNMTVFTVSKISVQNAVYSEYIDKQAIAESSGIKLNSNIFFLNEKTATQEIERANPYLEVTSIERKFPSQVVIHVTMREAVMSMEIANRTDYAILSVDLKILAIVDRTDPLYLMATHVDSVSISNPVVGERLASEGAVNKALLDLGNVSEHEGLQFYSFFDGIHFENHSMYIELRSGVTIRIDNYETMSGETLQNAIRYALAVYRSFDELAPERRSGYIFWDVSNPEEPVWRWSENG